MINIKYVRCLSLLAITLLSYPIEAKEVKINNIICINQNPELPTGCEVTALAILMKQSNFNVDKMDIAKRIRKADIPKIENGKLVGEHPNNAFIGSPYSSKSYGVYIKPLIDVMGVYMDKSRIDNLTDKKFDELLKVVGSGRGVLVIITNELKQPITSKTWTLKDGSKFNWLSNEHSVVLNGYTDDQVIVSDPINGKIVKYDKDLFKLRWEQMGSQAVAIKPIYQTKEMYILGKTGKHEAIVDSSNNVFIPIRVLPNINSKISVQSLNGEVHITERLRYKRNNIIYTKGTVTKNRKPYDLNIILYNDRLYISESSLYEEYGYRVINNKSTITII